MCPCMLTAANSSYIYKVHKRFAEGNNGGEMQPQSRASLIHVVWDFDSIF